jgi:hypothetical protein
MKKFLLIAAISAVALAPTFASAAETPCEDSLKTLNDTIKTVAPKEDVMAKVKVLLDKALERCNADDDKRSNGFVADAMKLMGK